MLYLLNHFAPLTALAKTHVVDMSYQSIALKDVLHYIKQATADDTAPGGLPLLAVTDTDTRRMFTRLLGTAIIARHRPFELVPGDRIIAMGFGQQYVDHHEKTGWTYLTINSLSERQKVA